jgi:hypothetical protein
MSARANASRLAGPGIGGLLLAHSGMAAVSALVALLYFIALVAVLGPARCTGSSGEHEAFPARHA